MVTPDYLIIFNALALTLSQAVLIDLSQRCELEGRIGHRRLGLPLITSLYLSKVEKNITSDLTCSRSGNKTQFPLPEARVVPRLHVQVQWQEAPLDHGQAQGCSSEVFWRREPGFSPYLHFTNSHRPPGAVQREQLSKGSWHHRAHCYVSPPLAPSLLLLDLFRQNSLKLHMQPQLILPPNKSCKYHIPSHAYSLTWTLCWRSWCALALHL